MKQIIIALLILTNLATAQTCRTESEIKSTTPNNRFTDNNNSTISDNGTALMWQKCQLGLSGIDCTIGNATNHSWEQALSQADMSLLAGYNDWRLPNYKELLSIIEQRCDDPSINSTFFPNTSGSIFWTASPSPINPDKSLVVIFLSGSSNDGFGRRNTNNDVRLVRTIQ